MPWSEAAGLCLVCSHGMEKDNKTCYHKMKMIALHKVRVVSLEVPLMSDEILMVKYEVQAVIL